MQNTMVVGAGELLLGKNIKMKGRNGMKVEERVREEIA